MLQQKQSKESQKRDWRTQTWNISLRNLKVNDSEMGCMKAGDFIDLSFSDLTLDLWTINHEGMPDEMKYKL